MLVIIGKTGQCYTFNTQRPKSWEAKWKASAEETEKTNKWRRGKPKVKPPQRKLKQAWKMPKSQWKAKNEQSKASGIHKNRKTRRNEWLSWIICVRGSRGSKSRITGVKEKLSKTENCRKIVYTRFGLEPKRLEPQN